MQSDNRHGVLLALLTDLREKDVVQEVDNLLRQKISPHEILATCQEGMRRVGRYYQEGEYYISGLIMAGEIMRQVALLLEPAFKQEMDADNLGVILLGTIKGDIHDIGKNLFKVLLRCQGFEVKDLGVDVQPDDFVIAARRTKPDIIAISSLLTVSYEILRDTIVLLKESMTAIDLSAPVMIGGGMVNANVCEFVNADYWAPDAMAGVQLCKRIAENARRRPSMAREA
jgi:methanogenic corrinoid protein MtbC1